MPTHAYEKEIKMANKKITDKRAVIDFRGVECEISIEAMRSFKIQRDAAKAQKNNDMDLLCELLNKMLCGNLDKYIDILPEENGEVSEYGASVDTIMALINEAGEFAAKN